MRVVRVPIGTTWLHWVLRGHDYTRVETNWPKDAAIIGGSWDHDRNRMLLTVTSVTFDEVPEGHVIPEWSPTVTLHMDEQAQLLEIVHRSMVEG